MNQLPSPTRSWLERGEEWLGSRLAGWWLLGLLAVLYFAAYLWHPLYPGDAPAELRQGWWSWSDQFAYWKSAAELAQFRITPEGYHYPLGYPLLGALFWRLMPTHAFFVPDLLLVLGTGFVWWRLARRWLGRLPTLVCTGIFMAVHARLLALTVVIPWNTIATQLTLVAGMWVVVSKDGPRAVGLLAGLAAATYLVRPGDAACFAPMLVWAVLRLPARGERLKWTMLGVTIVGTAVASVAVLNFAVFGAWGSPYERESWGSIGFFSYPFAKKVYWLFVDGRPFFGETDTALLFRYPWLFLALPGAIHWVRREGWAAVAALASLGLNWALYVNYNDFLPSDVFRYSLIHYISWGFLPLFALAFAAVLHGWRQNATRVGFALAAGLVIACLGLQMEERARPSLVGPGRVDRLPAERPLWVSFPGVPLEQVVNLRLDGRKMREASDYQIPYVPSNLRLLLSSRAQGVSLTATAEAGITVTPVVGAYVWSWRFDPGRLKLWED